MVDKECLLNILINLVAFFRIACKKIVFFCFIIKNSAIFAPSNDYKFRQNDEESLS